jgi:hypothetical protein
MNLKMIDPIRRRLEKAEAQLLGWQPEFFDEQAEIVFLLKDGQVPSEVFALFPAEVGGYAQALFDLRRSEQFQISELKSR